MKPLIPLLRLSLSLLPSQPLTFLAATQRLLVLFRVSEAEQRTESCAEALLGELISFVSFQRAFSAVAFGNDDRLIVAERPKQPLQKGGVGG